MRTLIVVTGIVAAIDIIVPGMNTLNLILSVAAVVVVSFVIESIKRRR